MTTRLEAAATAIHDEFCREDWHSGLEIGQACYDMKHEAAAVLAAADAVMFSEESIDQVASVVAQRISMTCPSEPNPRTEAGVITRLVIEMLKAGRDE